MGLTKTQKVLYNNMLEKINLAKQSKTYNEYVMNNKEIAPHFKQLNIENNFYKETYLNLKNNIVLALSSSTTLRALENKGYIKIIKDGKSGVDVVKVIKY